MRGRPGQVAVEGHAARVEEAWREPHRWRRPQIQALDGLVVAGHPLAASVGASALIQGGNAVDAAVAIGLALAVLRPQMCGLGGDLFAQVYWAPDRSVHALNANGPAPRRATRQGLLGGIPTTGPQAGTVPGAIAGWAALHERFGTLPWAQLCQPAIRYALHGFPVYARLAHWIEAGAEVYRRYPASAATFLPGGSVPRPGERFRQPALGAALGELAAGGPAVFYGGALGRRFTDAVQGAGGLIDEADLAAFAPQWLAPIRTSYRGYSVCEQPPTSQGYLLLQLLNMLEPYDLGALGRGSARLVDLMVRAKERAFAERDAVFGDPAFVSVPMDGLLSKEHAARLLAEPPVTTASISPTGGDTTAFVVVDARRNAVTGIQSHFYDSGFVAGDTGILLNGRLQSFSLDPASPNVIAPGKRPLHTLNTWLVLAGEELRYAGGSPGAHGQVPTNLQVIANLIDFGMGPQAAVEAPRWLHGDVRTGAVGGALLLEPGFAPGTVRALRRLGHDAERLDHQPAPEPSLGSAKVVAIAANGTLTAGVDPRRDAYAVAL